MRGELLDGLLLLLSLCGCLGLVLPQCQPHSHSDRLLLLAVFAVRAVYDTDRSHTDQSEVRDIPSTTVTVTAVADTRTLARLG